MSDIHALSGAYAVDALDDLERAQFERHLAECEICRSEVDSLREAAALLVETTHAPPPGALRERVLAEIATVRPLPPVTPASQVTHLTTVVERRRRFPALVAAAAAVIALVGGGVVWQVIDDEPLSQTDLILQADDAEQFTQSFPGGAVATITVSKERNGAVIETTDMPEAPDGHSYALWLQHDVDMVPAGIMPGGSDNTVLLSGDAATADGAGITVEPAGEVHDEPEGEVVALFDFEA